MLHTLFHVRYRKIFFLFHFKSLYNVNGGSQITVFYSFIQLQKKYQNIFQKGKISVSEICYEIYM